MDYGVTESIHTQEPLMPRRALRSILRRDGAATRADFAAGLDQVLFRTLVEILLPKRCGIERVEQLAYFAQPDLDERMVALASVCGCRGLRRHRDLLRSNG